MSLYDYLTLYKTRHASWLTLKTAEVAAILEELTWQGIVHNF